MARTLRDELGVELDVSTIVGAERTPAGLFSNDARTVSIVGSRQVEGFEALAMSAADSISSEALGAHTTCDTFATECTHSFVGRLGRRLFRRPLERDEIARYAALFEAARSEGVGFDVGRRLVLEAMLQSPHFLYRVEREPTTGARDLDAHELASRLSYLIWGSSPDAELSRAADDGSLTSASVLEAQVDRLIEAPRASEVFLEMVTDWLQLRDVWSVSFDLETYGEVDDALRVAMVEETHALFRDLWNEDRPLMEMLTRTDAWLSPELARNYGLEPTSSESTRYELDGDPHRSGILTRAAVVGLQGQVSRAQSEPEPSVVHRGKFLLQQFFCGSIPPPPNDVANDPSFGRGFDTEREAVEIRSANARCAGCHASIDPLGLSMLTYDNLGRHREVDVHGHPVSSDGVFYDVPRPGLTPLGA
ncbi:MAG: DUF1592 domain-containing protein [Myxococcota bacterium]|jgi:hypothetical protein|nr:DUF1592 domain-containing protein [Myxococcota bacterium]